jgi:antitoxin MazE
MQTQIQKWGNSLGIRIPKNIANELKLEQGIYVNLDVIENQLLITSETTKLDSLLNEITKENQHHEILNLDYKVGKEEW